MATSKDEAYMHIQRSCKRIFVPLRDCPSKISSDLQRKKFKPYLPSDPAYTHKERKKEESSSSLLTS